jgi:hypothetical protein
MRVMTREEGRRASRDLSTMMKKGAGVWFVERETGEQAQEGGILRGSKIKYKAV